MEGLKCGKGKRKRKGGRTVGGEGVGGRGRGGSSQCSFRLAGSMSGVVRLEGKEGEGGGGRRRKGGRGAR